MTIYIKIKFSVDQVTGTFYTFTDLILEFKSINNHGLIIQLMNRFGIKDLGNQKMNRSKYNWSKYLGEKTSGFI